MNFLRIGDRRPIELLLERVRSSRVQEMGAASKESKAFDLYGLNLAKLIPAEAFSLHVLGANVDVPDHMKNFHIWPMFCLLAALIYRAIATSPTGRIWTGQWWAIIISGISFVLWTYAEGDWFFYITIPHDFVFIVKYCFLFWIFLMPAFVGAKKR